jgi:hypothetical protein
MSELGTPADLLAQFRTTMSEPEIALLVHYTGALHELMGVKAQAARMSRDDKAMSHVILTYPRESFSMQAKGDADAIDRLTARGCIFVEPPDAPPDTVSIAWPLTDVLRMAKVFSSRAPEDETEITVMAPSSRGGLIAGNLEPF